MDEWTQLPKASVQLSPYNRGVLSHEITILLVNHHINTNKIMMFMGATFSTARSSCRCPRRRLPGFKPVSIIVICPITRRICTAFERDVERTKLENFHLLAPMG